MTKISICIAIALISFAASVPLSKDVRYHGYRVTSAGQHKFAFSLLNTLKKTESGNILVSPLSVYNAVMLAYFGAERGQMKSFQKVLNMASANSKAGALVKYVEFKKDAAESSSVQLKSVEKIYVTQNAELNNEITDQLGDLIEKVDFTDSEARRADINAFVEKFTENNIKDLLPSGSVLPETNIVLLSAAYFKGAWKTKFDEQKTFTKLFNGANPADVKMMNINDKFKHGEVDELKAQYLVMPYEHPSDVKPHMMIVFLPNENTPTAVDDMLDRFTDTTLVDVMVRLAKSDPESVDIEFPKMSIEGNYDLDGTLKEMGLKSLFTTPLSDFSKSTKLQIEGFLQKTKLEVDEEGTVAAAATVSVSRGADESGVFHCDHPFAYVIVDDQTNEITFAGIFRNPN